MTRQQYRQLQRKRPDLRLFSWSLINLKWRWEALHAMTDQEFIAWRTHDLLVTESGQATELDKLADNCPPC